MAAASTTVRALLLGPPRALRVVATASRALYLADETPGPADGGLVAVLAPDAVRVPFGVVLDTAVPRPGGRGAGLRAVAVGDPAHAGGGTLAVGGLTVRPLRWWDPAVPALHAVAGRLAADLAAALARPLDPPDLAPAVDDLVAAVRSAVADPCGGPRTALAASVRALVGRGPGLTPAGDDVLAGALCALAAVRPAPAARALLADVVRAQTHRTTPVSAGLLAAAVAGCAVPQVVDVLRSLARPDGRLAPAVGALLDVGHTSGTALAHGLAAGLRAAVPAGRVAA